MSPTIIALAVIAALVGLFFVLNGLTKHKEAVREESHKAPAFGTTVYPNGDPPAEATVIGPKLWDGDHSTNMPQHPTPHPSGVGWVIRLPRRGEGKLDYVGFPCGSLDGKTAMDVDYELTLTGGAQAQATPQPDKGDTGTYRLQMTSFFEEGGDDWSADGFYEAMRWYFDGTQHYLEEGAHSMTAPLAGPGWNATVKSTFENNPAGFHEAITKAYAAGVVFGGNGIGIGHGGDFVSDDPSASAELWVKSIRLR